MAYAVSAMAPVLVGQTVFWPVYFENRIGEHPQAINVTSDMHNTAWGRLFIGCFLAKTDSVSNG
jgi:hypothetical protein